MQQERDFPLRARFSTEHHMITDQGDESANLLTLEQVASYLNINKFTIYRLINQKKMPAFKVGNQWRFKQEIIDAWLMAKANIRKKKSD